MERLEISIDKKYLCSGRSVAEMYNIATYLSTINKNKSVELSMSQKFWNETIGNFNIRTTIIFINGLAISYSSNN